MVHSVVYDRAQILDLCGDMRGDVRNAKRHIEGERVQRVFGLAEWRRAGNLFQLGSGRALPLGQAVHAVVHNDGGDVQVARGLRRDMLVADAEEVAVPRDHDDIEVGPPHLDAERDG